mmetsp:Transcript_21903/g.52115  ORF Transcript_21903/g.52115 Transcript_21903/m.52115 type:complete len:326 (+) Transcript_21903:123-1100(+)
MKLDRVWNEIPCIGLGTWKISQKDCMGTIDEAMRIGYRAFDCACDYDNEQQVGEALACAMKKHGVQRHDLFITSKLWCTFMETEHVESACRRTLSDLNLEYLDLYLIHFPIALKYVDPTVRYPPGWTYEIEAQPNRLCDAGLVYSNVTTQQTWQAMEELVKLGLTKHIGVANFNCALLRDLLKYAEIRPKVNQIELHPYLAHNAMLKFCERQGIQVTAFHSFGGQSLLELGNELAKTTPALLEHPTVREVAEKHELSTAQVLLRWALERGATVIPKSINPERLQANIDVTHVIGLDEEDMARLNSLDRNLHFNDPNDFADTPIWS